MNLKFVKILAGLAFLFTSFTSQAAFETVVPTVNATSGYDFLNLNGAQGLTSAHFEGPLPTKVLFSNDFQTDVGNQSPATVGGVVATQFGLESWDLVGLGGGTTVDKEDPYNFLAIHVGKNEFLFYFVNAVTQTITFTTDGNGNGVGDYRVYNGTFAPNPVPVPAAVWLFGSALAGMFGFKRKASK